MPFAPGVARYAARRSLIAVLSMTALFAALAATLLVAAPSASAKDLPGGISASELIKDAKLGDAKVGEAQISERNANFIIVGPKATSRDVLSLVELVRTGVAERMVRTNPAY